MILVADSGPTKTAWSVFGKGVPASLFETVGINPVRDSEADILAVLDDVAVWLKDVRVDQVYFYGAGCVSPYAEVVERVLRSVFEHAAIAVESDLLGAARAMCGHQAGIACILGTGSNSCYYDGERIVNNVSPLGWILGDEGSGAVLGRQLVGDVLKGQLPAAVCAAFEERFHLTRTDIIEAVYRQPLPNRFLASLVPFLSEQSAEPAIHAFLVREFRRFFVRNVVVYGHPELPVHFVGGIASHFPKELSEAAELEGLKIGRIEGSPILDMTRFHGG